MLLLNTATPTLLSKEKYLSKHGFERIEIAAKVMVNAGFDIVAMDG